jgi:ribosomal protein S18 acetylase RimI-like enzyme
VTWRLTADLDEFLALAGAFLAARPVEHTLLLTVTETLRRRGLDAFGAEAPLFGWWLGDGGVTGAFVHTPPYHLAPSPLPEPAVPALADALGERGIAGVAGDPEVVRAFAAARGSRVTVKRRERLYRLGTLTPPQPGPPGRVAPAATMPRELLLAWMVAFQVDIAESPESAERQLQNRLDRLRVWERDGEPVSLAGSTPPVAGTARIGPVYTPPEQRGHGYAGALTAAVCRELLDAGVEAVVLFADLDNATSTGLYVRLGFEALRDRLVVDLHEGDRPNG